VLFHCSNNHLSLPFALAWIPRWLQFGHFSVGVFIVLSGYCLMLPVARSADGTLKGGIRGYLRRRARRILPPYYAVLVISLLFNWVSTRFVSHDAYRSLVPGEILSHVLLIHNLRPDWIATINWPLWSVPVEWQIYFFLPLVFLPLWRKRGAAVMLAVALVIGLLPHFLLPARNNFDWSCPWYLGLFTLGATGAILTDTTRGTPARIRHRTSWFAIGLLFAVSALLTFARWPDAVWLQDNLVGLATVCLILGCVQHSARVLAAPTNITTSNAEHPAPEHPYVQNTRSALPVRILESPFALWLGSFSYSLYLIQQPAQRASYFVKNHLSLSPAGHLMFQLFVTVPWVVLIGWVFYMACERHFVSSTSRTPLTVKTN
jgi:peptidoglycan/LPS O-acetylase OafA/YrhL